MEAWGQKIVVVRVHSDRLASDESVRRFTGKAEQVAGPLVNTSLSSNSVSRRTALISNSKDRQFATLV